MGIPMPARTPTHAWAEDHDNATMAKTTPAIKTALAFIRVSFRACAALQQLNDGRKT
jgi:hypothetical protein